MNFASPDMRLYFVDDHLAGTSINGHDVVSLDGFAALAAADKKITIAVADPATRITLAERCEQLGLDFFSVVAASAVVMDEVAIGIGALISPFVTITSNISIGRHFHANINSYVEHDCVIGNFVTFAPGVRCNGNVHIEDEAYIGSGAIIRQGTPSKPLTIGKRAFVGMGAVVTKDVPAGATVIGNPARVLKTLQPPVERA
jgi:sugar O-acyltransferase (sialic acid O-acetyltransferase NeuD family)